jgi:hypothetical protein
MTRSQRLFLGALALGLVSTLLALTTGTESTGDTGATILTATSLPDIQPLSVPDPGPIEEAIHALDLETDSVAHEGRRTAQRETRLLAAGFVADRAGRPVANASILVDVPIKADDLSGRNTWKRVLELHTVTDSEGRFQLDGHVAARRLGLNVTHARYATLFRVECESGAEDVRLELRAAGSIAGRLLIDRDVSYSRFAVSASAGEPNPATFRGSFQGDGSFTIGGLPPGTFSISVGFEHEPGTAQRIEQVNVTTGFATQLAAIDMRGRVRSVWLHVLDATGAPAPRASVQRRAPDELEFPPRMQNISSGKIQLATLRDCLDLRVVAPGHRSEVLECVSSDTEVRLQHGPAVRLILEKGLTGRDLHIAASLTPRGEARVASRSTILFDERGVAHATLQDAGTYDVRVYAWQVIEGEVGTLLSNRVEDSIEVNGDPGEQSFTLNLDERTVASIETHGKE